MSLLEIIDFARKMAVSLRDGVRRAAHYLRSVGVDIEIAMFALLAY